MNTESRTRLGRSANVAGERGCLGLLRASAWVAVPVGWLWIGSRIVPSGGLATAIGAMMIGMLLSVAGLVSFLAWVNRKHVELQEVRGVVPGTATALELVLVASAVLAIAAFTIWFFGFSGSSPIPLNISY